MNNGSMVSMYAFVTNTSGSIQDPTFLTNTAVKPMNNYLLGYFSHKCITLFTINLRCLTTPYQKSEYLP